MAQNYAVNGEGARTSINHLLLWVSYGVGRRFAKSCGDMAGTFWRSISIVILFSLIGLSLSACGTPPREEICRRVLEALLPPGIDPRIEKTDTGLTSGQIVTLRFTETGLAGARGRVRSLRCAFAPSTGDPGRYGMLSVELDGIALSRVKLILLHRWLGQEVPTLLLTGESTPHWPLGLHIAYLAQQMLNGAVVGSVLALTAAGYTLVYAVTRHLQFAFGDIVAIGSMMASLAYLSLDMSGWHSLVTAVVLGVPFALAIGALTGFWMQKVAFASLRHANTQSALIAAIGMSLFLSEFLRLSQGSRERWLPPLLLGKHNLFTAQGFDVVVSNSQIAVITLATVLSLALGWLLGRTPTGRQYRATAEDPGMAALLGIDCGRVVATAYAGGAALAAAAGVAVLVHYGAAGTQSALVLSFKAMTAALLGGIGSFQGALLGGVLVGLFEALWGGYLDAEWRDAGVFGLLVLVLVFRPTGILGRDEVHQRCA